MKFTINDARDFRDALKKTANACADSDGRPSLQCVRLSVDDDKLTMTALDGFIMVSKTVDVQDAEDGACLVPPKTLLSALVGRKSAIRCWLQDSFLECETEDCLYRMRVMDAVSYIDTDKIWPNHKNPFSFYVNPDYALKVFGALKGHIGCVKITADTANNLAPIILQCNDSGKTLLLPVKVYGE